MNFQSKKTCFASCIKNLIDSTSSKFRVILLLFLSFSTVLKAQTFTSSVDTGLGFAASGTVDVGDVFTYRLQYSLPNIQGGYSDVVVTDTLPAGLEFISLTPSADIASTNVAGQTVTFTFVTPITSGVTGELLIRARFPNGTVTGTTVNNTATLTGTGSGLPLNPTPLNVPVTALNGSDPVGTSNGVQIVKSGSSGEVYLGSGFTYTINHGSLGGELVNSYTIEDTFPSEFIFEEWRHAEDFDSPLSFTVNYTTSNNATFVAWPGGPFSTDDGGMSARHGLDELSLAAGEFVTGLQFVFTNIPAGPEYTFATGAAIEIRGDISRINDSNGLPLGSNGATVSVGDVLSNTVTLDTNGQYAQVSSLVTTNIAASQNVFGMTKRIVEDPVLGAGPAPYNPGEFVAVAIDVVSPPVNVGDLVNPTIWDLLPAELEFVGPISVGPIRNNGPTPPLPNFEVFPNWDNTGRTLLKFSWDSSNPYTIEPTTVRTGARITFRAQIPFGLPDGNYQNEIAGTLEVPHICQNPIQVDVDVNDFDNDGDRTEIFCSTRPANYEVFDDGTGVSLNSQKWVKGECDTEFSRFPEFGSTVPGGIADYELRIGNPSAVGVSDIDVVDILPFVGDTGVVDTSARGSEWRPVLAGPVVPPASLPTGVTAVTIFYSTSSNPDRTNLGITIPGADDLATTNWTTTPPSDITTVRSLRFDIDGVLGAGDTLVFGWPMRAPLDAPTNGEIAWNSFGFAATNTANSSRLLATEPVKVGFTTKPQSPARYGDFVWFDTNRNGIQEPSEQGINGVRVELYSPAGASPAPNTDTLVGFTVTQNDGTADGAYIFSELAPGNYYAVFYPPAGFSASPADQGSDDAADSDGIAGTIGMTDVLITAITNLGSTDSDLTWDQGFFDPTNGLAIGDFVWLDSNSDGTQQSGEAGISGVTVKLLQGGSEIGSTVTNANGEYIFGGVNNDNLIVSTQVTNGSDNISISAVNDDAAQAAAGGPPLFNSGGGNTDNFDLGQNDAGGGGAAGDNADVPTTIGLRFNSVNIPPGATITSAFIQFSTNDVNGNPVARTRRLNGGDPAPAVALTIYGEAADNPGTFDIVAAGPANRTKTSMASSVNWSPAVWTTAAAGDRTRGADQLTPDLKDIVQEIVDRGGWNSGNSMVFLIEGTGQREAESFDSGGATHAPELILAWEVSTQMQNTITDNTAYQVCIDTNQAPLTNLALVSPPGTDTSNDSTTDTTDSDAVLVSTDAIIDYTATAADPFNMSLDFGFQSTIACTLDITSVSGTNYDAATDTFDATVTIAYTGAPTQTVNFVVGGQTITRTIAGAVNSSGSETFTFSVPIGTSVEAYFDGFQGDPDKSEINTTLVTPEVSIGNLVWNDLNNDGTYDPLEGELGLAGVNMELWLDRDGNGLLDTAGADAPVFATTTTSSSPIGEYGFSGLVPGNYFVIIPNPPSPFGLSSTLTNAPDNGVDDDDNGLQEGLPLSPIVSPRISLQPGEEPGTTGGTNTDNTVDFGLVDPGIGNLVWHDRDRDGVVDADEPGIPGVTVELNVVGGGANPVNSTTTDENGFYFFGDLSPADYQVVIPQVNFDPGGALERLGLSTSPSVTTDGGTTSVDDDDNGTQSSGFGTPVLSPVITLAIGTEPVNAGTEIGRGFELDDIADSNNNVTVDFGFVGCEITLANAVVSNVTLSGNDIVYDLSVTVNYEVAPATGNITVTAGGATGSVTPDGSGSQVATISGITLDEDGPFTAFASFDNDTDCNDSINFAPPAAATCSGSQVGGQVFRDGDQDGALDTGEAGVGFVGIRAYDCNNNLVGFGVSDELGNFTLTETDGTTALDASNYQGGLRIEFDVDNDGFIKQGVAGGTLVQFVTSSGNCNMTAAVQNPAQSCDGTPFLITPCYVNGDPTLGGDSGLDNWLVRIPYTPTADSGENVYLANGTVIGAVWGTAYQRSTDRVFTAAVTKRHSGYGIGGPGAIYQTTNATGASGTQVSSLLVDLAAAPLSIDVGSLGPRGLSADKNDESRDAAAFDGVGKVGLGDLDISEDGTTLYTINLNGPSLVIVPIDNPTAATEVPIDTSGLNLVTGRFRPWAVGTRDGVVYIGGVTTGELGGDEVNDLEAIIMQYTPGAAENFATIARFSIAYQRQVITQGNNTSGTFVAVPGEWRAWIDEWSDINNPLPDQGPFGQTAYPQPILSDIDFESDGTILLGFLDRFGMQAGNQNLSPVDGDSELYEGVGSGDILKLFRNSSGGFSLENNSGAPAGSVTINPGPTAGAGTNSGPGGGEFFHADEFTAFGNVIHAENSLGGIALLPGSNTVVTSAYDPINGTFMTVRSGGLRWYDTTDGSQADEYEIFEMDAGGTNQNNSATFGKAVGIGDVELACETTAIEIGNLVFIDVDADGVQDACDPPISGVDVSLYDSTGSLVAIVITDSNGQYRFSSAPGTNSSSEAFNLSDLEPNGLGGANKTFYVVVGNRFGALQFTGGQLVVDGITYVPTAADVASTGTGSTADQVDSDGVVGNPSGTSLSNVLFSTVTIEPGSNGCNNHSFDYGFTTDLDYGDAPNTYLTSGTGAASHLVVPGLKLGAEVDQEADGVPTTDATGDDLAGTPDDEDGVTFPNGIAIARTDTDFCAEVIAMAPAATATMATPVEDKFDSVTFSGGTGWANDWVDVDSQGAGPGVGRVQIGGGFLSLRNNGQSISRQFTVPAGATGYNLKFSSQYFAGATGSFGSLDVEINGSSIGTISQNGGTLQDIDLDITSVVSAGGTFTLRFDTDAVSSAENDNGWDLGCLTIMTTSPATGGDAVLVAWLDIDQNGTFDADEAQTLTTAGSTLVTDGTTVNKVTWPINAADLGSGGNTYARFRYSSDANLSAITPGGFVSDGEVEDYLINIETVPLPLTNCVYRDLNGNGVQDLGEPGIAGVMVTATDAAGNVYTAITGADGTYTLVPAVPANTELRIVYSNFPTGFSPSPSLAGARTLIVNSDDLVKAALVNSSDVCDENPFTFTPCYISGDPAIPAVGVLDAAVGFRFNDSGTSTDNKVILADAASIGSTWGAAYDSKRNRAYLSAVVRRHVALGPDGEGGIYSVDVSDLTNPTVSSLVTIPGTNPTAIPLDVTNRDIVGDSASDPSADLEGFQAVGRVGLGDIEISEDCNTLYVVNLGAQDLVTVDLTTNTVNPGLDIYDNAPTSVTNVCAKIEFRPWAVKVNGDDVYVGAVCSGEAGGTLRAFILQLNTAGTAFTELFAYDLPLSGRQSAWSRTDFSAADQAAALAATQWKPWIGTAATDWPISTLVDPFLTGEDYVIHAQPILADIECDPEDGSLILGFNDRQAMIGGFLQANPAGSITPPLITVGAGDIIRVENTGGVYSVASGEYYTGELWNNGTFDEHLETAFGSLAVNPQASPSEVMVTVYDPLDGAGNFNAGGTRRLSNATGAFVESFQIYDASTSGTTFAKAAGLGDLEIACDTPIVVGDFVFNDLNQDGIQDINEPGILGVIIQIFDSNGNQVGPDITTGTDGEWISPELLSGTDYCVVLPSSNFTGGGALVGFLPTTPNAGADNIDSELTMISGQTGALAAQNGEFGYCFNSGISSNFDIDFGVLDASNLPAVGNIVWIEDATSENGIYNDGVDTPVDGALVELYAVGSTPGVDAVVSSDFTDSSGCYEIRVPEGDYFLYLPSSNFTTGPLAGTVSVTGNGGDDALDDGPSGLGDNGVDAISPSTDGIRSLTFNLSVGNEPSVANTNDETGKNSSADSIDENVDYTWDFGFRNVALEPDCYANTTVGTIGPGATITRQIVVPSGLPLISASNPVSVRLRMDTNPDGDGFAARGVGSITLTPPATVGSAVDLFTPSTDRFAENANINVVFTDSAAAILTPTEATHGLADPFDDRPRLPQGAGGFGSLTGDPAGTWTITMSVDFGGYTHEFEEAQICFGVASTEPQVGVGNLVFIDNDNSGAFNSGDTSVAGVTLELVDAGNAVVSTAVTDANGCYSFTTNPGTGFTVRIPASNFQPGGPLESVTGSVVGAGTADDSTGEDGIDPIPNDLITLQSSGITSAAFDLAVDNEPTGDGSTGTENGKAGSFDDADDENFDTTVDFGFSVTSPVVEYDYGDLPELAGLKNYPTAGEAVLDRPRHELGTGLALGATVDAETDGQPSATAVGDGADEDGFTNLPDLIPGETYTIPFNVTQGTATGPFYLNAWIDYDCDGDLTDLGSQIADSVVVADGANVIQFTVPVDAVPGTSFARFRLSTTENLDPTGDASDGEVEDYILRIVAGSGAIGNYVWVDENSDGLQDAGERGIPNVLVELKNSSGTVIATTYTDSNGGYLFPELPAATYFVDVDETTIPTGFTQTATFTNGTGDFGNKDHSGNGYQIVLGLNEVNLTADFGYNANPEADVNTGQNTAALGDRVWIDADQDGIQDPEEIGVPDVTLTLMGAGPDGDFTTTGDNTTASATTDATGYYLFDGLAPGAYMVTVDTTNFGASAPLEGYTQFGDPDHFAAAAGTAPTGTAGDNKSTAPVVLGPGDVFLNVDFGYDETTPDALLGSIGDRIYLDEDNSATAADGDKNTAAEPGISGVTIALIQDTNGDGIYTPLGDDGLPGGTGNDADEPIVGTAITDASGCYLFDGLPFGDYLVQVTDTDGVLTGLTQTYDEDGPLDNTSAVTISVGTPDNSTQDFGYSPNPVLGSIGDTVWADLDSSGGDQNTQGAEPGIPGVTVTLRDSANNVVATTVTDSNGNYLFDDLALGTYTVEVDTTGVAAAGYGTAATFDPDGDGMGGFDNSSSVTITVADPHDREQDFSYPPGATTLGSVGDKVWLDNSGTGAAGDATQGVDEPGIAGVVVTLTPPSGVDAGNGVDQPVTTTTNAEGCYLFTDLPLSPNAYTISVVTPTGLTPDFDSDTPGDNTSTVVVNTGTEHPRTEDFSFDSATPLFSIGNTVWFDADADGALADDPGDNGGSEAPIPGVTVLLLDASGDVLTTDVTDSNGQYLFDNLPGGVDYMVQVDTTTLPSGVSTISTYENDAMADSKTTVTNLASDVITEDFAYPPAGAIGDKIFFDSATTGTQDANDGGIPGVIVQLQDGSGTILANTTTNDQGCYLFDNLPAGSYTVVVDPDITIGGMLQPKTLPVGLTNSVDPDTGTLNESNVTLAVGEINLTQDFGYNGGLGAIGTLVWEDHDADGTSEPTGATASTDDDEPFIADVTVDLYLDSNNNGLRDAGEPRLASTTTTGSDLAATSDNGNYLFQGLPVDDASGNDVNYIVHVSDDNGALAGYWHSLGTQAQTDNDQSKEDEYAVTLSDTTPVVETADFGYYKDLAKLGNYVWLDAGNDGIQDAGAGIANVPLTLTITYPGPTPATGDDTVVTLVTTTDATGNYNFCNLLADEDYSAGGGVGRPTFAINVTPPTGFVLTTTDAGSGPDQDLLDSDADGVTAVPVQGLEDTAQQADATTELSIASYDFGLVSEPKPGAYADFLAGNAVALNLDDNTGGANPGATPVVDPITGLTNAGVTDVNNDDAAALTDNPDGDVYNNLLEFALCFDPGTGLKVFPDGSPNEGFHLEQDNSGPSPTLNAKYTQPTGVQNVSYELQTSSDGQVWSASALSPSTVDNGNGTTTVCYNDVLSSIGATGLLRLQVTATGTGMGVSATAVTTPIGWNTATVQNICLTYADPYLLPCLFTGTVDSAAGEVITVTNSAGTGDLTMLIDPTSNEYYVEVVSGDNVGHRFDIASVTATTITVEADADLCAGPPYNTATALPVADLAGDQIVIREHRTLSGMFPESAFNAGTSLADSAQLLFYDRVNGMYEYVELNDNGGSPQWQATSGGADQSNRIIPPSEGLFTHNLGATADVSILQFGEVRTNSSVVPLKENYNLIGSIYPIAQSPDGVDGMGDPLSNSRQMNTGTGSVGSGARSRADQIQVWRDDFDGDNTQHLCYDAYFYALNGSTDQWSLTDDSSLPDNSGELLFPPDRSALHCIYPDPNTPESEDRLDNSIPSPISNTPNP